MSKLKVSMREIGGVRIFDLEGDVTHETIQEIAWKIQRNIRRYRLQRIIINLQQIPVLEPVGLRKILAACIRPQRSLIFGASDVVINHLENTYLPRNVRVCHSEKEVAEDLGPFLLEKNDDKKIANTKVMDHELSIGTQLERRRSKRMHVALPLEIKVHHPDGHVLETQAIATNISEGGLFAEYLDLEVAKKLELWEHIEGAKVDIHIYPSQNFPEEYSLTGSVRHRELNKKQLGLGIEFLQ